MLALSQEVLLSDAPHLAASGHIQICLGLKSSKKTGVLPYSNGGYLSLLLLPREEPSSHPFPCPPLPLEHSEMGPGRARALLVLGATEKVDLECSSLGSSACTLCQGNASLDY